MPYRGATEHRRQLFGYTTARWRELPVELCVGVHDGPGPFSLATAVNRAAQQATGDVYLIFGCDHLPPSAAKLAWIEGRLAEHPWTPAFAAVRILSERATRAILDGSPPAEQQHDAQHIPMCTGILAMRAEVFWDVGGMDERFRGWGYEDTAFRLTLATLHGSSPPAHGELWSLWHPIESRAQATRNERLYLEYERAARRGELRQYLQEVRRGSAGDH
jgi:hypothetical protein